MQEGVPSEAEELSPHPESDLTAGTSLGDLLGVGVWCDLRHMA